jgi:pyrimidine operon attenuation protein/uracil phosphoribosyltransferase
MLAALVDRGGRELPIAADFVAASLALADDRELVLERDAAGKFSLTVGHA